MRLLATCLLALGLLYPSTLLQAEIYKYKDENGRWQFTDKKPDSDAPVEVLDTSSSDSTSYSSTLSGDPIDVTGQLEKRFKPKTALQRATITVVAIETPVGVGSGFFVSDTGLIVTNRHVIRPEPNARSRETEAQFEKAEEIINRRFDALKSEKSRLQSVKSSLDRMKNDPTTAAQYQSYRDSYERDYRTYEKYLRETQRMRDDYRSKKSSFERKIANAAIARQFTVTLKDGTKLLSELVAISEDLDLALIRINAKTPFLQPYPQYPQQGLPVYAIGSPLGQMDSVTSGIVTRLTQEGIYTDAKILPGNSGGPMIDYEGRLIGVNTQKLMASSNIGSEGFGIAIPFSKVMQTFAEHF